MTPRAFANLLIAALVGVVLDRVVLLGGLFEGSRSQGSAATWQGHLPSSLGGHNEAPFRVPNPEPASSSVRADAEAVGACAQRVRRPGQPAVFSVDAGFNIGKVTAQWLGAASDVCVLGFEANPQLAG